MMVQRFPIAALLLAAAALSPGQTVLRTATDLVVPTDTGTVRLQVLSPQAVRVVVGQTIPKSFVIVTKPRNEGWTWSATNRVARLRTSALEARVDRSTGVVTFWDVKGNPILTERGRSLAGGAAQQAFQLVAGEAVYGLGQHQGGVLDYRGTAVHLQQQNTEIAVPFLLSSRGYGLLWDNASVTDVSVGGGESEPIPSAAFRGDDGTPGLTGRYYVGTDFGKEVLVRQDSNVDFDWTQAPPPGLPHDGYSVRWTGTLEAAKSGTYGFTAVSDDGVRLWIDGKPVFADWTARARKSTSGRIALTKGRHSIRLEYFQNAFDASIRLTWQAPASEDELRWRSEMGRAIDYTFLYGPKTDAIISEYRRLTGPAPMLPRYAFGLWQSKERYTSQQELLDVVREYRRRRFPVDGIIQDWHYWSPEPWGSHVLNRERYPDPAGLLRQLHAQNVHLLISVWGKFVDGIANARQLEEAGALYPQITNGERYYDAFDPKGRSVYWSQIRRQLFPYVDGWWLDASEPELGGTWGEYRNYTTARGPATEVFNAYPLFHTQGVYEGQRAATNAKRVVILTRSAYLGQQRNSAIAWSGDIQGNWDVFRAQIPAGINFSLSGLPYWNTDIGGFFAPNRITPEYEELFTRWYQYGAFCSMFRVHGTNIAKEPWRFSQTAQRTLLEYDRLRYHLLPYVYSTAWQVTNAGASMMRGLVFDFQNDPKALAVRDQYLFGPSILVSPVTEPGATSRSVYLPQGTTWIDFWTGRRMAGGQTVQAPSPLSNMPLFVRAGAIVPYGPEVQNAAQASDPLEIRIYSGADGAFTLYDDAGDGYQYEKGQYATIPLRWNEKARTLTIGSRKGRYPGMPTTRNFHIVLVGPGHGVGVDSEPKPVRTIRYGGTSLNVKL